MSAGAARRGAARVAAVVTMAAAMCATVHQRLDAGTLQPTDATPTRSTGMGLVGSTAPRPIPSATSSVTPSAAPSPTPRPTPSSNAGATPRPTPSSGAGAAVVARVEAGREKPVNRPAGQPVDCRRVKCVALTFDDGPGPYTDTLLRHLAAHQAPATFFVVGQNVAAYPSVLRRTAAAGHEIGNHTWSHQDLTKLSAAAVRTELARTDEAVKAAVGFVPALVRPPYGAFDNTLRVRIKRPLVLWSVDTLDWLHRDSARVARVAIRSARPGGIILFHDIHPTTVKAVPRVLKALSRKGYTFVTVSQLFDGHPPRLVYNAPHQPGSEP
ncbi:polysaccharide deacetylase family protein [Nonomuraea wenchangensis]|uniref:polysaccharide deacetylase family protein n=1 Tax=Nonomuraea wenchangensis TaxID=568860 RepID=UPI00331B1833